VDGDIGVLKRVDLDCVFLVELCWVGWNDDVVLGDLVDHLYVIQMEV